MDLVIDKKRKYKDEEDEDIVNLSDCIIDATNIHLSSYQLISEQYTCRIDRFTNDFVFPSSDAIDTVMYANNITNPFSINEGDSLFIPLHNEDLYVSNNNVTFPKSSNLSDETTNEADKFINKTVEATNKLKSTKDDNRQKRLERIAEMRKSNTTPLSPNMLQKGQSAKKFQSGKIILGANINTK